MKRNKLKFSKQNCDHIGLKAALHFQVWKQTGSWERPGQPSYTPPKWKIK